MKFEKVEVDVVGIVDPAAVAAAVAVAVAVAVAAVEDEGKEVDEVVVVAVVKFENEGGE